MHLRASNQYNSKLNPQFSVKLVERLPPEYWDSRRDPEWVVDLFDRTGKTDTTVLAESVIESVYVTDKQ